MDDAKQQLIDRLQTANNILVTVSHDPSIDQLASCIGLTLLLNKQGKHAAAVFSGKVPSTLEFLQPDATLEKNTDSLRDFIISLDKSKADKLRYKVEEDVVRIFITPYKTSLSADDLEFSEGDFNVDVVVALGVQKQEDLDQAITAHGRILHDATVTSINTSADGGLGTINWHDPQASSLSELVTDLSQALNGNLLDEQIATALLTGIVSETGRFSNDRTSSQTMSASALLLSAGANQQLVASKLDTKPTAAAPDNADQPDDQTKKEDKDDGVLEIDHAGDDTRQPPSSPESPLEPASPPPPAPAADTGNTPPPPPPAPAGKPASTLTPGAKLVTEPPTLGGTLTASTQDEHLDPVTDPMSMPKSEAPELLDRGTPDKRSDQTPPPTGPQHITPPPAGWTPPPSQVPPPTPFTPPANTDNVTLTDLEKSVDSPHLSSENVESARDKVDEALSGSDANEPIKALNAQPLGSDLHTGPQPPVTPTPPAPAPPTPPTPSAPPASSSTNPDDPNAPPPVPPPIPFQFGNPPSSQ
ncbi:MAG TPA: hypothetical protein VHA37_06160 [Candidatus Saccharimonadales bacterium]|nr:hypothetical protein [Candidatus Saccharimonadales bacterium]